MPICNCGRPCVNRDVSSTTFRRHRRLEAALSTVNGADWQSFGRYRRQESRTAEDPPVDSLPGDSDDLNEERDASDSQAYQRIAQQLINTSHAIRLLKSDHLVLDKKRRHLHFGHPNNAIFELHDENLRAILRDLRRFASSDQQITTLYGRLIEWAHTLQDFLASLLETAVKNAGRSTAESEKHMYTRDTGRFFHRQIRHSPLIVACLAVMSALFLFLNVSRLQTQIVGRLLEALVNTAFDQVRSEQGTAPKRFALGTYRLDTALRALQIESEIISYVCCPRPSCCALYTPSRDGTFPEQCTATIAGAECGYRLGKKCISSAGSTFRHANRMYHTQSVATALGCILSRPGIEESMEQYVEESLNGHLDGATPRHDIWHGSAMPTIPWTVPLDVGARELRLVFSLTIDWFNAHHSSQRGKSWSVGAVYLTILNLPPHLRDQPENTILVGLIPGPQKPIKSALQNFIEKLVDELLLLWNHGVYYTRTSKCPTGRLVRAALGPLICDLDAARPVLSVGGHSHSRPCSFCWITREQVHQRDVTRSWNRRTRDEHTRLASEYASLSDDASRDRHWKEYGVRPSALQRLGYWDHLLWTVIDPMHNWYLGVLSHHLCELFGLKPNSKGRRLPIKDYDPEVNPGDTSYAYCLLRCPNVTISRLVKLQIQTLKNLAGRLQLYAGSKTKKQLATELLAWKNKHNWVPDLTDEDLELLSSWLKSVPSKSWARTIARDDLRALVYRVAPEDFPRHITSTSSDLVELLKDRIGYSPRGKEPMGQRAKYKRPPLGDAELSEIRADRDSTIFPLWLSKGPAQFGAAAHGALSANEARTAGLYHVPLTLIRLWGKKPLESTERQRLNCYLHLVEATDLAGRHTTFEARWLAIGYHVTCYLMLLNQLFPTIRGTPNEHLALHQPELLRRFGPSRGWWGFAPERRNGMIQRLPSNHLIGNEMELGQLRRLLVGEDFKFVMETGLTQGFHHIRPALERCISGDYEGDMLLDNARAWSRALDIQARDPQSAVARQWLPALQPSALGSGPWFSVWSLRDEASEFKASSHTWVDHPGKTVRNALIMVNQSGKNRPAIIRCIASQSRRPIAVNEIKLVVQYFSQLDETDGTVDPFRSNSVRRAGASRCDRFLTCYSKLEPIVAVSASDLICHFGYTPYEGFSAPAGIVTVLDRIPSRCGGAVCMYTGRIQRELEHSYV